MKHFLVIIPAVIQVNVYSQTIPGFKEYTYKQIDTINLKLFVKNPDNFNEKADVPINYADYYYLEALLRSKKLNEKKSLF